MMATAPMVGKPAGGEPQPASGGSHDAPRQGRVGVGLWCRGLSGIVAAVAMPRGPVTAWQALVAMMLAAALGLFVGLAMRSRWAMLVGPLAHTAAFEIGRLGAEGPTVDGVRFDGVFPVLAFMSGRGVWSVLVLAPMVLGATLGAAQTRRASDTDTA